MKPSVAFAVALTLATALLSGCLNPSTPTTVRAITRQAWPQKRLAILSMCESVTHARTPALCEFARLFHDTGQHEKALPLFEQAVSRLDQVGAPGKDPVGIG